MPFQSKSQMRGAFSGAFGPEMKAKAKGWADETKNPKALPERKKKGKKSNAPNPQQIMAMGKK